jgi:hypothetical protein
MKRCAHFFHGGVRNMRAHLDAAMAAARGGEKWTQVFP